MHKDFNIVTQVALVVKDADAKAKAFAEIFGVDIPQSRIHGGDDQSKTIYHGEPTDACARLVFFELGNLQIEIIEPDGKPSIWQQFLEDHGEGIHHIAFHVENMQAEIARLEGVGLQLEQRGQYPGGEYAYLDGTEQIAAIIELLADC